MKLQHIIIALAGFFIGALVYGMDWQREQDKRMSAMDKLIMKQSTILEMQVDINENNVRSGVYNSISSPRPHYTEDIDVRESGVIE